MLGDRLLIIDDDRAWGHCASRYFSKFLNYTTYTATTLEEGLNLLESVRPDFVLTDYHFGEEDAGKICRHIRSSESLKKTFVTVVSGDPLCKPAAYAECQADNFILKGTDYETMHNILQNQRRRACLDCGITEAGDIALQVDTRQVYHNSMLVTELCKEHFDLFSLLVHKSPEYVSEEDIFKNALGAHYTAEKHAALAMMFSRLRQKLGPIGERIQNKKNFGWRYFPPEQPPKS